MLACHFSGCFSAPLEKAIRLLEQRCKGMEEKGVVPKQLKRMHGSLEQMKGRLDVLRKAKEVVVVRKYGRKSRNRCRKELEWYLGRSRRGLTKTKRDAGLVG